ncbi:MAG: hypothetical protein KDA61_13230 [Planctomycetales bacterium]|nr:hypothetical protein [Planctomycetales bacterium]
MKASTTVQTCRRAIASRLGAGLALCLGLLLTSSSLQAQTIVDTQGFGAGAGYSTTFNGTGQLEGQVPATFNGTCPRTVGPGLSSATVQTAVVKDGGQAVQVDRAADSDDRWAIPVSGYPSTGVDMICITWDMLVRGPASTPGVGTFGPLFGVEAYDDDAASIGLLGSLFVDATTGDVLYQSQDDGVLQESGTKVLFNEWNNYDLVLDYATKTYNVYVNGVQLLGTAEGFVDENNVAGGLAQFTDADIAALAGGADVDSAALTGTAFFDNFAVLEGADCLTLDPQGEPDIPEPTTAMLVLVAALGAARRRS